MATATTDVDAIRRRMAEIRRELHEDVRGVVDAAESAWNWRGYIRAYPWAALAIAAGAGYLIVPHRRRSAPAPGPVVVVEKPAEPAAAKDPRSESRKKSLISAGLGMLATLALRSAQNYALHYAQQWLAEKQMQFMHGAEGQGLIPTQVGPSAMFGVPPGAPPGYGRPGQGPTNQPGAGNPWQGGF